MSALQKKDERKGLLAKVHIAKKDLALTDENYRDLLERVAGQRSCVAMSLADIELVVGEFRRLGWREKKARSRRASVARSGGRTMAKSAQAMKIRALWLSLYHLGEIRDPSEEALAHFVERQTGIESLQWADRDANKAIEALKDWCERAGFRQPTAQDVESVNTARVPALTSQGLGFAAKVILIHALWEKLIAAGAMRHGIHAGLGTWLTGRFGVTAPQFLDPRQADQAVESLGSWLRKATRGEPA